MRGVFADTKRQKEHFMKFLTEMIENHATLLLTKNVFKNSFQVNLWRLRVKYFHLLLEADKLVLMLFLESTSSLIISWVSSKIFADFLSFVFSFSLSPSFLIMMSLKSRFVKIYYELQSCFSNGYFSFSCKIFYDFRFPEEPFALHSIACPSFFLCFPLLSLHWKRMKM